MALPGHPGEADDLALGDGHAGHRRTARSARSSRCCRRRPSGTRRCHRPPRSATKRHGARLHRHRLWCRSGRTCRCPGGRWARRSRRCTRRPAPGTRTGPAPGWRRSGPPGRSTGRLLRATSAARSASSCAFRVASAKAAIAISVSSRVCRSLTSCDVSACCCCTAASLASSVSLSCLLLLLLLLEIRLLALEQVVDRRQLLHDVVVGLVGLVEQLLAADRRSTALVESTSSSSWLLGCVYANTARCPGDGPEVVGVRLRRRDRVLELGDGRRVCLELVVGGGERGRESRRPACGRRRASGARRRGRLRGRAGARGQGPQMHPKAMRTGRTRRSRVIEQGLGARGSGNATSR